MQCDYLHTINTGLLYFPLCPQRRLEVFGEPPAIPFISSRNNTILILLPLSFPSAGFFRTQHIRVFDLGRDQLRPLTTSDKIPKSHLLVFR